MMSSSLSISRRRFVTNSLKSYWWLMLINAILYFLVGPMLLIMHFGGYNVDVYQPERWQRLLHNWFYIDGFYGFYLLTMFLGVVMGLVMFNFLHHKRQVNFYHALPITRKAHFLMRMGIGAVLVFVPLVVMLLFMIVIVAGYGGDLGYLLLAALGHLGRLILFFCICYGLTILAGQLTGNVLTHIFMTLLLHFGLLLLYGCFLMLGGTFFNTFYISGQVERRLIHLSPVAYLIDFLDSIHGYSELAPFVHMSLSGIFGVGFVALAAIVLAFVLYLHRPSEVAGQSVVYKCIQQPLKWVILFFAAALGTSMFLEMSGKKFMVFGCLLFAVLTQMAVEVVLNKDFKAIGKNWQSALVFAILYLALLGSMYYDVWGYDRYVPQAKDVQAVQISFSNLAEGNSSYYGFDDSLALKEPEQIASVVAILEKVTKEEAYMKNAALYYHQDLVDHEFSSNILVKYTMGNGRTISRMYYQTPVALYEEDFARLYNSQEYKQALNLQMMATGKLEYVSVDTVGNEFLTYIDDKNYRTFHEDVIERDVYGSKIKEALQKDLQNRSWETLKRGALYVVDLQLRPEQLGYSNSLDIAVYADDVNTLAVIDKLQADNRLTTVTMEKKLEMIERVDIYRLADNEEESVRNMRYRDDLTYIEKFGTKLGEVTEPAAIATLLPDVVTVNQLSRSSAFVQVDYHYIAVAQIKDEFAVDDQEDNRIVMYYLKDCLPE